MILLQLPLTENLCEKDAEAFAAHNGLLPASLRD